MIVSWVSWMEGGSRQGKTLHPPLRRGIPPDRAKYLQDLPSLPQVPVGPAVRGERHKLITAAVSSPRDAAEGIRLGPTLMRVRLDWSLALDLSGEYPRYLGRRRSRLIPVWHGQGEIAQSKVSRERASLCRLVSLPAPLITGGEGLSGWFPGSNALCEPFGMDLAMYKAAADKAR